MSRIQLLVLVILLGLLTGVSQAKVVDEGAFLLYLGGVEAGREEFVITEGSHDTKGQISAGMQSLAVNSRLTRSKGALEEYQITYTPGAVLSGKFSDGEIEFLMGPVKRAFSLEKPYVVLDNNVFSHYQQLLGIMQSMNERLAVQVVVPSLVLANQDPLVSGQLEWRTTDYYVLDDEEFSLNEYVLTLPGNLQVRLLGNQQNQLIQLEIPMQGVLVIREGYHGLHIPNGLSRTEDSLIEEEFAVVNDSVILAGTLALPAGQGPFPAVLLNSGSGPQDRDGNTPPSYMTDLFKIMKKRLTEKGYAVLSYDERGVGESSGDYDQATLRDLLSDIEALLDYLSQHDLIDEKRIAMLGHSEGAYFAPLFAERLSALILLAGASIPLDQLMVEQVDHQLAQPWLSTQEKEILEDLRPKIAKVLEEARDNKAVSEVLPLNLQWLREHMALDPKDNLSKVTQPVLLVQGEEDLKVMPYHGEVLAETLKASGNEQVTIRYLAGTTHEFLYFPIDNANFDPLDPWRLNPELFEIIIEWVQKHL